MTPEHVMVFPNSTTQYRFDPSGYIAYSGQCDFRSEGWKFHISAHPYCAEEMAQLVMPVLQAQGVFHKHLQPDKLRTRVGEAVGKFIAYYPKSCLHAHTIAAAIDHALGGQACAKGPVVKDEQPFGISGVLYTRYGSYTSEWVRAPEGKKSMDPPRQFREYHKGKVRPSWITALLDDHSDELFPKHERNEMKFLAESNLTWQD
jgi:hypothetical protein